MNSLCPTSQSNLTRATTRGRLPFTLRSDLTRARPRGRSPFTLRSDFLERQGEVAPAPERPHHSDTQRSLGLCQFDSDEQAGSDVPQRLPEVALSTQSDLPERGAETSPIQLFPLEEESSDLFERGVSTTNQGRRKALLLILFLYGQRMRETYISYSLSLSLFWTPKASPFCRYSPETVVALVSSF
ncbi:hypothetical protein F2Q68_00015854 [Brassica cretica]|uniref:Uncharacterized protein n=1 Tax=Brassica cretica TaxID=69181 RepID=A0A8S9HGJ1_BRACR|nr:hypothetical protein F2Q68_00015854 [Brassica cretica]